MAGGAERMPMPHGQALPGGASKITTPRASGMRRSAPAMDTDSSGAAPARLLGTARPLLTNINAARCRTAAHIGEVDNADAVLIVRGSDESDETVLTDPRVRRDHGPVAAMDIQVDIGVEGCLALNRDLHALTGGEVDKMRMFLTRRQENLIRGPALAPDQEHNHDHQDQQADGDAAADDGDLGAQRHAARRRPPPAPWPIVKIIVILAGARTRPRSVVFVPILAGRLGTVGEQAVLSGCLDPVDHPFLPDQVIGLEQTRGCQLPQLVPR